MKGQYNIYPFFTHEVLRTAHKNISREITKHESLKYLFIKMPEMRDTLNYNVLSDEYFWEMNSRIVIFPDTVDVLSLLNNAKFKITQAGAIKMPHECFLLAFPKGYELAGVQASGCLIMQMSRIDRFHKVHEPFYKWLDLGTPYFMPDVHNEALYISYFSPYEHQIIIRACIPNDIIADCLQAKTAKEFSEILGSFDVNIVKNYIPLDDRDLEYQFQLFQAVAKIGVYTNACDTALRSGYPTKRPKHLEPKGIKYKDMTLGLTHHIESSDKAAHFRTCHFRQLVDKRYYKGEHANKEIGSRVIFVKDSMVGKDIDAETLK